MEKPRPAYLFVWWVYIASMMLLMAFISYATFSRAQTKTDVRYVELVNPTYRVVYDLETLCPAMVAWQLDKRDLGKEVRTNVKYFKADTRLPSPRALYKDYTGTGWVRGHILPAKDRSYSKPAQKSTFIMSNCAPMDGYLNQGDWLMAEAFTRSMAIRHRSVNVLAGTLFADSITSFVGQSKIQIPSHLWRIVYVLEPDTLVSCFIFPNAGMMVGLRARQTKVLPPMPKRLRELLPKFLQSDTIRYKPLN